MSVSNLPSHWQAPRLSGQHVTLEPLALEHAQGLALALEGDELSQLWYTNVPNAADVATWVRAALAKQGQGIEVPFAVRDADGVLAGSTRFYEVDSTVPKLSIGYTWYARRVQRTGLNTEAKLLLLTHAFETLGCAAVYLETSWFNHASRTAIARLGAKQDGVLRNHRRHADGTMRDTVVFSIIDREWAGVKSNLVYRLEQGERKHGQ
ncbi:MAG: GNAT family protein [Pseudoxanthomonas sp.]